MDLQNIAAVVGIIAGLLYIEEWLRHRRKEKREERMTATSSLPQPKFAFKWQTFYRLLPIITVSCCVVYLIGGELQKNRIAKSIPAYDEAYFGNLNDASVLSHYALDSFDKGEYVYCSMFYRHLLSFEAEALTKKQPIDRAWWCHKLQYEGVVLFTNPTAEGYQNFSNSVAAILNDIRHDIATTNTASYYYSKSHLNDLKQGWRSAEKLLKDSQLSKDYFKKVEQNLQGFEQTTGLP